MMRSILHLDIDAFFASVEQRDDPALRGRPVAVGSGVVASCSYESRRFGVHTGMRLAEARYLCPQLIVLSGDYRRYEQAAKRVLAIALDVTDQVEVAALDDLYLDLTRDVGPLPDVTTDLHGVAERLRRQVREEVGLSASIGMGTSKLAARVATKKAKPGGQVLVPAGAERDFLAPWPVEVLYGVGYQTCHRLERIEVRTVGQVAGMPLALILALFGKRGRTIHEQAHGIDPRPVTPRKPQQSVARCTSFETPVGDRVFLDAMLDHLLERAVAWLRGHDLATRGLSVQLCYSDYERASGRANLDRMVQDEKELKEAVHERFGRLYRRRLPLRLVGVELSPLGARDRQPSLFPDPEVERGQRLEEARDEVRKRFGFMSLQSGSALLLNGQLEHDRENYRLRTACLTR